MAPAAKAVAVRADVAVRAARGEGGGGERKVRLEGAHRPHAGASGPFCDITLSALSTLWRFGVLYRSGAWRSGGVAACAWWYTVRTRCAPDFLSLRILSKSGRWESHSARWRPAPSVGTLILSPVTRLTSLGSSYAPSPLLSHRKLERLRFLMQL
eukprot:5081103-Prymnesium_polylepis.1